MNRSIVFRLILTLVLLVVVAGLGIFAYNAGVAQGLAQNIQAAGAAGAKSAQPLPYPYYGMPFAHPYGFPGFGFLGCLIPLFLLFIFFGLMRAIIWRGPHEWRHHRMHGWHGGDGEEGLPPMFAEWHRRAHGEKPEETPEKQ
jgi:hypothetical protein